MTLVRLRSSSRRRSRSCRQGTRTDRAFRYRFSPGAATASRSAMWMLMTLAEVRSSDCRRSRLADHQFLPLAPVALRARRVSAKLLWMPHLTSFRPPDLARPGCAVLTPERLGTTVRHARGDDGGQSRFRLQDPLRGPPARQGMAWPDRASDLLWRLHCRSVGRRWGTRAWLVPPMAMTCTFRKARNYTNSMRTFHHCSMPQPTERPRLLRPCRLHSRNEG